MESHLPREELETAPSPSSSLSALPSSAAAIYPSLSPSLLLPFFLSSISLLSAAGRRIFQQRAGSVELGNDDDDDDACCGFRV